MLNNKTIEKKLLESSIILKALQEDQVVKDAIARIGYLDTHIDNTVRFHQDFEDFYRDSITTRGDQKSAGILVQDKFKYVYKRFSRVFDICKNTFSRDPKVIAELGLHVPRSRRSLSTFIPRAQRFYNTITKKNHIIDTLTAAVGIIADFINAELAEVDALEYLYKDHVRLQGESQRMTFDREKKSEELDIKMKNLKSILFMAFENDNLQILERVNIFVRNSPIVKKETEEPSGGDTTPSNGGEDPSSGDTVPSDGGTGGETVIENTTETPIETPIDTANDHPTGDWADTETCDHTEPEPVITNLSTESPGKADTPVGFVRKTTSNHPGNSKNQKKRNRKKRR